MPSDNIFTIEKLKEEIASSLPGLSSNAGLKLLTAFYELVLSSDKELIIDAYSAEFINDFLLSAHKYSPRFQHPDSANSFLRLVQRLKVIKNLKPYHSRLNELEQTVAAENEKFISFLNGNLPPLNSSGLYFPLLGDITFGNTKIPYSAIEEIKIKILPAREKDTFLFVPAGKGNEQLTAQAKTSFGLALNYIKRYKKGPLRKHEVILFFENYLAEYSGDSLGTALTIGFIHELTRFYNLPYIVSIEPGIATTGGVRESGHIMPVGANSIEAKVETLFYSELSSLVIPREDEPAALAKLEELRKLFPNRNLRLISAETFDDLLERRSLIEIKKQSPAARSFNYILRNWMTFIIIVFFTIIASLYLMVQNDNNPHTVEPTNSGFVILNKYHQPLWNIANPFQLSNIKISSNPSDFSISIRIIDVDKDQKNEVLYGFNYNSDYSDDSISVGIALLSYDGKLSKRFSFTKKMESKKEYLTPPYGCAIFDTLTYKGRSAIIVGANNSSSYASALFILDLGTFDILSDTLWNSGHYVDAKVLNKDGIQNIAILSYNNGYKLPQFAVMEAGKLCGQLPSKREYLLKNVPLASIFKCYLLPLSDYSITFQSNSYFLVSRGLQVFPGNNKISLDIGYYSKHGSVYQINTYYINNDSIAFNIEYNFTRLRDSLVKIGGLPPPLTDTREYRDILTKKIKAWNGKEFVDFYTYKKQIKN